VKSIREGFVLGPTVTVWGQSGDLNFVGLTLSFTQAQLSAGSSKQAKGKTASEIIFYGFVLTWRVT